MNYALVHDSAAVRLFTFGRLLCSRNVKTHELNSRDRARALTPRTGSPGVPGLTASSVSRITSKALELNVFFSRGKCVAYTKNNNNYVLEMAWRSSEFECCWCIKIYDLFIYAICTKR